MCCEERGGGRVEERKRKKRERHEIREMSDMLIDWMYRVEPYRANHQFTGIPFHRVG